MQTQGKENIVIPVFHPFLTEGYNLHSVLNLPVLLTISDSTSSFFLAVVAHVYLNSSLLTGPWPLSSLLPLQTMPWCTALSTGHIRPVQSYLWNRFPEVGLLGPGINALQFFISN